MLILIWFNESKNSVSNWAKSHIFFVIGEPVDGMKNEMKLLVEIATSTRVLFMNSDGKLLRESLKIKTSIN